jgi:hypothetical protein
VHLYGTLLCKSQVKAFILFIDQHGSIIEKEEARPERLILISPKHHDRHCFAPRTAFCTIIVSDSVIICSAIFSNASAVENFIPVFFSTLLKLA